MSHYPPNFQGTNLDGPWSTATRDAHDAFNEIEAKLETLHTWDAISDFHDDGVFEIMDKHGADHRDCDEFEEVYAKVKAKLDALDGVAA